MVSKVAVIALVAIVACPILLGFGLNLAETTVTEYKVDTDEPAVNVSRLLTNGTAYTLANADTYTINSSFAISGSINTFPEFASSSTVKAAFPYQTLYYPNWGGGSINMSGIDYYYLQIDQPYSASNYFTFQVIGADNVTRASVDHVVEVYLNAHQGTYGTLTYRYTTSPTTYGTGSVSMLNLTLGQFKFIRTGNVADITYGVGRVNDTNFVDISAGYHFTNYSYMDSAQGWLIELPDYTFNALMSINLDSITASSYTVKFMDRFVLQKTTVGGVPKWTVTDSVTSQTQSLYYNTGISNNTYQMYVEYSDQGNPTNDPLYPDPYKNFARHVEFRYIGDWQDLIGVANYYMKYEFDYSENILPANNNLHWFKINGTTSGSGSPIIRMDAATFSAFTYQLIENQQYNPVEFRSNPSTTISNVQRFGSSLVFGGITYAVDKDGNITLGTHKVSVNKIVLSTIPNSSGGYDNKINGITISNTPYVPSITFNGKWSADISTVGMVSYTYQHTEWTPGQFAWNGIDQNFLMIGLLAALGVFIALGIAYKKVKGALAALLIVCGGAILLFFTML